jgi:23S rRNA (guanine2069-N7)-methyltransferase
VNERVTPGDLRTGLRAESVAAFEQRLAKTYRHWSRWGRRQGIGAFRCYDRDVPEFPLAIDCYVPADGHRSPRLHVQELDTGWMQSAAAHAAWVGGVTEAVSRASGIAWDDIVYKHRPRRARGVQHDKTGVAGEPFLVLEGDLKFWVNLEAYLDTGLFPDHRRMRAMVRARASGKRMLNLFGYTGSFTVYAAAGGAQQSATVDLSNTYLAWAARNLAANGIAPRTHELVRADVLPWLEHAATAQREFDIIVCDPPAFSHSKRMRGVLDVQRDHPELIRACLRLLAPRGELYFSTNLRSFALDPARLRDVGCKDITRQTHAKDFRDPRVHQAFLFTTA